MAETSIEWTERTWNPVTGCDRVSPGCAHCYALTKAKRLKAMGNPRYQQDGGPSSGPGFGVTLHPDKLDEPLRRRKPTMYFVNSMSDLFHEEVPDSFIAAVWTTMARAQQHTFQILTKRPERMAELVPKLALVNGNWLPNVQLGVSIENRRYVDRADLLRETPAAVRFISAEPLIGPLLREISEEVDGLGEDQSYAPAAWSDGYRGDELDLAGIDWLVVGGESGPGHRPMDVEWVRDLRDACLAQSPSYPSAFEVCMQPILAKSRADGLAAEASRTAFFFKQWGGATPKAGGRVLDGRTWDEMPVRSTHV